MKYPARQLICFSILLFVLFACRSRPGTAEPTAVATPNTTTVAIEATATPAPSIVTVRPDEGIVLDDFPVNAPFVLHFNQPMQTAAAQPLRVTPETAGQFQWNDEQTSLTFTPDNGFDPGRTYAIRLMPELKSVSGLTFTQEQVWRLKTQTARSIPRVIGHTPNLTRITERQPIFELIFDRPMLAASVTGALSVEPAVPFTATWAEETLSIAVQAPLAFDTTYIFTLADTAVDEEGLHLARDYTWEVRLKPLLDRVSWPTAQNHLAPITIAFNYPLDTASFSTSLQIKPDVSGKLAWNDTSTIVTFTPDGRLPVDTSYTISFTGPLRDQDGRELLLPEPINFVSPPSILSSRPSGENAEPASLIKITFDRPMDEAVTEAAFQIEPQLAGAFIWEETTLIFRPDDGYLAEYSDYTVTIATSARGADGEPVLRQPYTWSFRTKALADQANFGYGPNAQVLDANGRRAVQFQALSRDNLNFGFELYRMTREQFLDRYASNFRGWAGWNGESLPEIDTRGTELVAAWQMETADPLQEYANVQETIIPADVPPGLYILNLTAGRVNDQLILTLTENTLTVKEAEGQLVAWVTDINGEVVPGLEVGVYARSGDLLQSGVTNANGIFRAQIAPFAEGGPPSLEPLILMAGSGPDITVSGLAPEWLSNGGYYGWWQPAPTGSDSTVYLFTERPIYQPGQELFFKAIVRRDDDAILSLFAAGTAVTVRLRDARDNVVQTQELQTNDFGTVNGRFSIAEGAMLGTYHLELVVGEDSHRQAFKVQDYRKPDYQVTVTTDAAQYIVGDTIEVTVDTRYFFGQPVPNAEVTIRRYGLSQDWSNPGQYIWYEDYETMNRPVQGRTDENGRFTTNLRITSDAYLDNNFNWISSLRRGTWGIEATVDDGSHQTVSGFAVVDIFDADAWIDLETNGYVHVPEQPFNVHIGLLTIAGEPVAERPLTLSLRRWQASTYDYTTIVQEVAVMTGADGRVTLPFTIAEPGYYQLRVEGEDSQGRAINATSWVYAFSVFYSNWYGRAADNFTVEADRDEYTPGDVAQLIIETPVDGPALLTVERGTVRREELIQLTSPVTMIELPIQAGDTPNVYVAVNVWQPQSTELDQHTGSSLPDSGLLTAYTNLSVPATDKILNVTITPDKETYAPGETASFTMRVTNQAGVPVSAEVALGMVDEAIYALSDELVGPIYDGFYYERNNIVRTYNSLAPIRWLWEGGIGGGGGDGAVSGPRRDFPDTAAWFPSLYTDFNGEATVTVTIPDSLTTWRLTARAATADTQVGETTAKVLVTQEVIIRPLLPRVLTAGDIIALSAVVHNYSDAPQELAVTLVTEPPQMLRLNSNGRQTVIVPPGGQRIVGWQTEAMAASEVTIMVTAALVSGSGPGDAIELPLTIQPLAIPDVTTQVGQFSGQFQTTINVPASALPMSSIELQLSRSIAGSLLEGLEYLTGYPYGCVEQTMSRALPNAVVGRALNQLGVTNPTLQANLPAQINASIQRLYGYQHNDGGWGWWYDDPSHDYQTAWVIFGLAQVAQAGYEIDPAVIERGAEWLNQELPHMDSRTQAFALYALAEAGLANEAVTLSLAENRAQLDGDEFSLAGLALALHQLGENALARSLVAELAETAVNQDGRVHWHGANHDGYYYQKTMASDIRTTALALSAFSRIRPGHELEAGIVRWLMDQRRSSGWGTTNETSFAILGLTDHLLATSFNETAAATIYSVRLNGLVVAEGTLGRGEPAVSLTIPRADLKAGSNTLSITQAGVPFIPPTGEDEWGGQLYYVLNSRMYLPEAEIEAAGNVAISRTYLDGETSQPLDTFVPGQLVQVQLKVNLPETGTYIIVEDKLPGGLEALNEGLNTTSHVATAYGSFEYQWQGLGYNNKEVHGDRVTFFITEMERGVKTFTYFARATHAGDFKAMPAEVYAMYNLALWGRSASSQLIIQATEDNLSQTGNIITNAFPAW